MSKLKEMSLEELREIEIALLNHMADFCDEKSIKYFISNGTLLGGVKYGGFIPWDDDIDILLPREEYEKLVSLYEDRDYQLMVNEKNKSYLYPFAKLCDVSTILVENGIDNGVELGVNIDIIPLDYLGSDYKKAVRLVKINHLLSQLLLLRKKKFKTVLRDNKYSNLKKIKLILSFFVSRFMSSQFYIDKINKNSLMNKNNVSSEYVASAAWPVYEKKEVLHRHYFEDSCKVEFEGKQFSAPIGFNEYLKSLYGDYKQNPPKEKQVTHHSFVAYKK